MMLCFSSCSSFPLVYYPQSSSACLDVMQIPNMQLLKRKASSQDGSLTPLATLAYFPLLSFLFYWACLWLLCLDFSFVLARRSLFCQVQRKVVSAVFPRVCGDEVIQESLFSFFMTLTEWQQNETETLDNNNSWQKKNACKEIFNCHINVKNDSLPVCVHGCDRVVTILSRFQRCGSKSAATE